MTRGSSNKDHFEFITKSNLTINLQMCNNLTWSNKKLIKPVSALSTIMFCLSLIHTKTPKDEQTNHIKQQTHINTRVSKYQQPRSFKCHKMCTCNLMIYKQIKCKQQIHLKSLFFKLTNRQIISTNKMQAKRKHM